jgi:hypothetical protein
MSLMHCSRRMRPSFPLSPLVRWNRSKQRNKPTFRGQLPANDDEYLRFHQRNLRLQKNLNFIFLLRSVGSSPESR